MIGYQDNNCAPPNKHPNATASFPSIKNCFSSMSLSSTKYESFFARFSLKYSRPNSRAFVFSSIAESLPLNCFFTADSRADCLIPKISAKAPTYTILVINLASLGFIPLAILVIGIGYDTISSLFISSFEFSFQTTTAPGSNAARSSSQVAGLTKT